MILLGLDDCQKSRISEVARFGERFTYILVQKLAPGLEKCDTDPMIRTRRMTDSSNAGDRLKQRLPCGCHVEGWLVQGW